MTPTMPRKASEYRRKGLSVSPSDGGWLASYKNSVNVTQEIGIWPDEAAATRAGVLWCQGYRFDVIRAEYEAKKSLSDIGREYQCCNNIIRECVVFGGGEIRIQGAQAGSKNKEYTGEKLEQARERAAAIRVKAKAALRHKRIIAALGDEDDSH